MCETGIHEIGADAFDPSDDVTLADECHGNVENAIQPLRIMMPSIVNPARSLFDQSA